MSLKEFTVALAALGLAACSASTANPRLALRYEKDLQLLDAASFVARAAGAKDVQIFDLGRTAWVSHHVAVIRTEESPHYHRFHDLTVTTLSGVGVLDIEGRKIPLKAGDVSHVGRGIRHFFRNTGKEPAVAFVVFSPPYDGRDTVTAELPETKAPREEPKRRWWWPFGKKGLEKVQDDDGGGAAAEPEGHRMVPDVDAEKPDE